MRGETEEKEGASGHQVQVLLFSLKLLSYQG